MAMDAAFPYSFQGSTSSSFNNVSRSILLFVQPLRARSRAALAGKARSSTQPLRRSRGELATNGLSCFRLLLERSGKVFERTSDRYTEIHFRRLSIYSVRCRVVYAEFPRSLALSIASRFRAKKFREIETTDSVISGSIFKRTILTVLRIRLRRVSRFTNLTSEDFSESSQSYNPQEIIPV